MLQPTAMQSPMTSSQTVSSTPPPQLQMVTPNVHHHVDAVRAIVLATSTTVHAPLIVRTSATDATLGHTSSSQSASRAHSSQSVPLPSNTLASADARLFTPLPTRIPRPSQRPEYRSAKRAAQLHVGAHRDAIHLRAAVAINSIAEIERMIAMQSTLLHIPTSAMGNVGARHAVGLLPPRVEKDASDTRRPIDVDIRSAVSDSTAMQWQSEEGSSHTRHGDLQLVHNSWASQIPSHDAGMVLMPYEVSAISMPSWNASRFLLHLSLPPSHACDCARGIVSSSSH